jgi:hypothetical protein
METTMTTQITLIPVQSTDDRPLYGGGSGRPVCTASYHTADGRIAVVQRPWTDAAKVAALALARGAQGTINVALRRHGKRGLVEVARWIASDASLTAAQVQAADTACRKARQAAGEVVLQRLIAAAEATGRDAGSLRAEVGTPWAAAYADDMEG